jgi:amino acid transporter
LAIFAEPLELVRQTSAGCDLEIANHCIHADKLAALPFSEAFAKVPPTYQTPMLPAIVAGVLAVLILVLNINQPTMFTVVTSIAIVMVYIAYLSVTAPMLVQRHKGNWPPP